MIIDKFDPNPMSININKLKLYRFIDNQTFQLVLAKPSDFLSKEPMEVKYSNNMSNQQQVEETYFDNLSNKEPIETNHSNNLFVKELVHFNIRSLIADNLTKRRTGSNLSKLKLVQIGDKLTR